MDYKYACVVDADGNYKTLVLVLLEQGAEGQCKWNIQHYTLQEWERLIDTAAPITHPYAGADGFILPSWNKALQKWVEGATAEEIAAWEAEHPAPEPPPMSELTMTQLAVAELAQAVEDNNTANQLAVAELAEAMMGGEASGEALL